MGAYSVVLAGTDGSEPSYRAVERAGEIARDEAAELALVCAYHPEPESTVRDARDALGEDAAYQVVGPNPAEERLRVASERAAARGLDPRRIGIRAREGEATSVLLDEIAGRSPGLAVVGNRGLNTLTDRIVGAVPVAVARRAACDVLIVHTTP